MREARRVVETVNYVSVFCAVACRTDPILVCQGPVAVVCRRRAAAARL